MVTRWRRVHEYVSVRGRIGTIKLVANGKCGITIGRCEHHGAIVDVGNAPTLRERRLDCREAQVPAPFERALDRAMCGLTPLATASALFETRIGAVRVVGFAYRCYVRSHAQPWLKSSATLRKRRFHLPESKCRVNGGQL